MEQAEAKGGVVCILAPVGRDAAALAGLVERAGLQPAVCSGPSDLLAYLATTVDVVVVTEEALYGRNLAGVEAWVGNQPPWSDQPFIILTNGNEGPKFEVYRRELVKRLRNVSILQRPLQAITLQAAVLSAERARRRQYEVKRYLHSQEIAAAQLEALVTARTCELEQANLRLHEEISTRERAQAALIQAQKIEALGQLVGGVAHDFNNLLMAVIGNLDLLKKGFGQDPRQNRLLNGAMEGARRGAALTQRLLAFARKQELQTQAIDIEQLVHGMQALIERSAGPMVETSILAEPGLPAASVDPNQLEMALLNLAVNARDAMPAGGLLSIDLSECAVAENSTGPKPGRYVRLTVTDTGEGMDAATLARAVEPFFSTKEIGKGTGLGLSMVFGLAEQSGGALQLDSALGQGTTISLLLPVSSEAAIQSDAASPEVQASPPARILVVDDDPLVATSTVALLEDLGHLVTGARSGPEALKFLSDGLGADLMITDYAMPGMTGVELAKAVQELRPNLPILLATGFAEIERGGVAGLPRLAKPFSQQQLAAQIAQLVVAGGDQAEL